MVRMVVVAAALIGVTIGALVIWRGSGGDEFADCRSSAVVGDAAIGGPFVLTRADGARVRFEDVVTRPTLLYFGYSFCPDFCPMDLARNARAAEILAERGIEVGQIFVSIDPARDTPEVVGDFATAIHPDIIGLTGSAEDVAAAAGAYRVYFRKADEDPEYYLMDHSTFSYLVAPEHPFLDFFRSGASAEEVAEQTACFAERLSLG